MPESLLKRWFDQESFVQIIDRLEKNNRYRAAVAGLDGSARSFFMAALAFCSSRRGLVVAGDQASAEKIYADLSAFYPKQVMFLPSRDLFMNTEVLTRSDENQQLRLQFLDWLYSGSQGIYVTTVQALLSKVIPPKIWRSLIVNLKAGCRIDRRELIERLVEMGYEKTSLTETGGHFSVRGEIIDIYPPANRMPLRLELFDEIIESLRVFDPATQRSQEKLEDAHVLPARELIASGDIFNRGLQSAKESLDREAAKMFRRGEKDKAEKLKTRIERHLERLTQPDGLDILSSYYPFFYGEGASLADYLPPGLLVMVEEPQAVLEKGEDLYREVNDYISTAAIDGDLLLPGHRMLWHPEEMFARLPCPLIGCSLFPGTGKIFKAAATFNLETKSAPYYHGQWALFKSDLQTWFNSGYRVFLFAGSQKRGKSLLEMLSGQGSAENDRAGEELKDIAPSLPVIVGSLDEGFVIPDLKLAVITEQNLLPRRRKKRRIRKNEGIRLSDYRELSVGDYVVHEQHGIGKYQGLSTLEIGKVKRDYLLLKYRGADRLYIPVEQVGLIQKYSGGESSPPRLHSLGGGEWQRLKSRVNRSVEELARELLSLYAARQAAVGHSYGPDHPWQLEFEANFPYEETPDQLRAVEEVKSDMGKNHPMDRLICGDVGYGKTEVAMRAAFKAVMEGKQAAFLVPTTVLAQQHYRTFRERFDSFPIRVAQLSRFVPKNKQKEIIKDLAAGKIDIVIGTHRLLSADISFNDLGLLVIDEEQRFGVRQKEKMKRLRLEVDTLAMTATPIPRTLHLSLAGARDLSVIDTPPEDRYPIQTYVLEYSENLVREAVQRELDRHGQVFLVYNRVDRINKFAERIQKIFPEASVAVGHGRLPEKTLEKIMADFQAGRYQILISTTIIESGLDIPNVNTLIVCNADKFGLAQLYQIRGRVGRSNRLAYAYLTYDRSKAVSETARKRLRAIKEFTELGSGFKIALQDLEIRGAGNILGAEQHGFITAVGFDLYCKLLDRAVAELKNEKREPYIEPRIDLPLDAYLPASYINAQAQKVDFYQRIYRASSLEELDDIAREMADRYGALPEPAINLMAVSKLRVLAVKLGVDQVRQGPKSLVIQFRRGRTVPVGMTDQVESIDRNALVISGRDPLTLKIKHSGKAAPSISELIGLFKELSSDAAPVGR